MIVLFTLLEGAASLVVVAAFGFEVQAAAHFGSLLERGAGAGELLRWGALVDMAGYLSFAPVVLYVGARLRPRASVLVPVITAGGLAFVLVGAIGAVLLASVGPSLVEGYATASVSGHEAARVTLEALGRGVVAGLWGTLELSLWGVWAIGVGWLLRREWRRLAGLALVSGAGMVVSSVRTGLTGRTVGEASGPLDLLILLVVFGTFGLFFVWLLWLAVRLWRGPVASPSAADRQ